MDNSIQVAGQFAQYEQNYPVEFTGRAGEYFRIWIVNLALTIVTLGIYSAWAKVRKKRYFYGNTLIDGEPFEYRGNPVNILKGRVIAAALLALNYALSRFYPALYIPFLILLAAAIPWFICRSLAFNAHNSAYRNIRFHFSGRYGEALKIIVGLALLIPFSLGLLYPHYQARRLRFIAERHRYGQTPFTLAGYDNARFYWIYGKASGILVACFFAMILFIFTISDGAGLGSLLGRPGGAEADKANRLIPSLLVALAYLFYLLPFVYVRARTTNVLWNSIGIGSSRFVSTLRARDMFALYLTNILAIIATLGLATPWAASEWHVTGRRGWR